MRWPLDLKIVRITMEVSSHDMNVNTWNNQGLKHFSNTLRRSITVVIALCALGGLVGFSQTAIARVIDDIRFVGNDVTVPSTLLQEMDFDTGADVDEATIERSRQAIMDLGLFKSVEAKVVEESGKNVLYVTVDEKHYWFVLPRLSRSGDGDISYGAAVRLHNVAGRNQTLIVGAKRTELTDGDLEEKQEVSLRYKNPRLMGSRFELRTDLKYEESDIDETRDDAEGRYGRDLTTLRVGISRWFEPGPSRGWRGGIEAKLSDYDHTYFSGDEGLFFDATVFSLAVLIEYFNVHDRLHSRDGVHYGYEIMGASESFLSDASLPAIVSFTVAIFQWGQNRILI